MEPSKIVKMCAAIVITSVVIICSLNFGNTDDKELIISDYNKTTQNYNRVNVSSVVSSSNQNSSNGTLPTIVNPPGASGAIVDTSNWEAICDSVHKQWGAAGFTYVYGGSKDFKEPSGNNVTIRLDCSGYTSYCLYVAGYSTSTVGFSSGSDYTLAGFTEVPKPAGGFTYNDLVPGDIVTWPGHVQIYAGPTPDNIWWNWGGENSTSALYANYAAGNETIENVNSKTVCNRSLSNIRAVYRAPAQ